MPFLRILLFLVVGLIVVVVGLYAFRPDPDDLAVPQAVTAPEIVAPRPAPVVAVPAAPPPEAMTPGDASSPAEMTAQEAEEAVRRLQQEQEEKAMNGPERPPDMVTN